MIFKATNSELKQIIVNAINASSPVGMGFLHHETKDYTVDEIDLRQLSNLNFGIDIDYFKGRMVKIYIKKTPNKFEWDISNQANPEYQSWAVKYRTVESLINSVLKEGNEDARNNTTIC